MNAETNRVLRDCFGLSTAELLVKIIDLEQANAALMTERTSLIATKRDQLAALTAERDMWRDLAHERCPN